jgi:hypothetical protein
MKHEEWNNMRHNRSKKLKETIPMMTKIGSKSSMMRSTCFSIFSLLSKKRWTGLRKLMKNSGLWLIKL